MKQVTICCLLLMTYTLANAQTQRAFVSEDYTITIEETFERYPISSLRNNSFRQMAGFPKGARGNRIFKNFRNLTLVDLNKDGADDMLWGADNQLFAQAYDTLLWKQTLSGVLIYPPSVADLDNNGTLEIAQATGGSQTNSRIYLLDEHGQNLPGWPLNLDGHWILTAPTLADVDDNGSLEILFNERDSPQSWLHIVDIEGRNYSSEWPVGIDGTLAVTPTVGDVDQDGRKEIYTASTTTRYLFELDGTFEDGWPQVTAPFQRYSYQSTILADLDQNGTLEIIGAAHGDSSQYFVLQADGNFSPGWPKSVPENVWTFNTPTVIPMDGGLNLFMSRPIDENPDDMLYAWDQEGQALSGFPFFNVGGLQGIITIADVDGDEEFEVVYGSNLLLSDGRSFIHAYEMNGNVVEGFPIRPRGWTLMNGVNIGDVNGDSLMDLVALTFTQDIDRIIPDSVFLNVYELNVPYHPDRVLWSTYKGSNARDGLIATGNVTSVQEASAVPQGQIRLFPNPVKDELHLQLEGVPLNTTVNLQLYNAQGQLVGRWSENSLSQFLQFPADRLLPGVYCLRTYVEGKEINAVRFVKM